MNYWNFDDEEEDLFTLKHSWSSLIFGGIVCFCGFLFLIKMLNLPSSLVTLILTLCFVIILFYMVFSLEERASRVDLKVSRLERKINLLKMDVTAIKYVFKAQLKKKPKKKSKIKR